MFNKILLPLDGSELAESAIPYVRDLAAQLEAEVYLLHACPPEHQHYLHMHQIYLNSIADGLRKAIKDVQLTNWEPKIQSEVITGDPVKIIFDYVKEKDINLISLTSCGSSGFRPWSIGNIAEKVVRGVDIPVLLIRVKNNHVPRSKAVVQHILAPLDTSDASRITVPYAVELAKKLKASIILFSMAQTIYARNLEGANTGLGGGLGVNWDSVDAATEKSIDQYLQTVEDEIRKEGVEVSHITYLGIDPAYEILEMEKKTQADIVIMATRGRSPVARWAFGSVAEKVLREGDLPLLLIREHPER